MARTLTPVEAYALMDELRAQATGQKTLTAVNESNFVSVGEDVLATGYENTLNALSLVLGRTIVAARPYKSKFGMIQSISTGAYSHRLRKISYYSRNDLPAGNFNTNLFPKNLIAGATHQKDTTPGSEATASMWLQNPPVPLEQNFAGSSVWQTSTTTYRDALKMAFSSVENFSAFAAGALTELGNDIESDKESFRRAAVLQHMGMIYDAGATEQKVNLTAAYNTKFGTSKLTQDLLTTDLQSFLSFMVARMKLDSDRLTERTALYHDARSKTRNNPESGTSETLQILRHTPKDKQKLFIYDPLLTDASAQVMPTIFNPDYLGLPEINIEYVGYWQSNYSETARSGIKVTPAVYNAAGQTAGSAVSLDYVVGLLFDEDALITDYQLDSVDTTPFEARKHFANTWYSFARNIISDPTENAILYYMAD